LIKQSSLVTETADESQVVEDERRIVGFSSKYDPYMIKIYVRK